MKQKNLYKLIFIGVIFLFVFVSFIQASSESGCEYEGRVYSFGETARIGDKTMYCNTSGDFIEQKEAGGSCINDFECKTLSCFSDRCVDSLSSYIKEYEDALDKLDKLGVEIKDLCIEDHFCSNVSVSNATKITDKTCVDKAYSCYKCKDGYTWNDTLSLCIKGMCNSQPGCLSNSTLEGGTKLDLYCGAGKSCFSCDDDHEWDSQLNKCVLKSCGSSFSPGCLNISNLTNSLSYNRSCSSPSERCYVCKSGYKWDNSTNSCIVSSSGTTNFWITRSFTNYDFEAGNPINLGDFDRIKISFNNKDYYLGVRRVYDNRVEFEISSVINSSTLYIGSNSEFDLNNDGKKDVVISLRDISNSKGVFIVKKIIESSNPPSTTGTTTTTPNSGTGGDQNYYDGTKISSIDSGVWIVILVVLGLVVVGIIVSLIIIKKS